jgi:hypothetical protein
VLRVAGLVFEPDPQTGRTRTFLPDPPRLQAAIAANNLPLRLVPDAVVTTGEARGGAIPGDMYAKVVRSGQHPVGVATVRYYRHDLSPDGHLPAAVIGGRSLISWFVEHTPADGDLADVYDEGTSYVTRAVNSHLRQSHARPRKHEGINRDLRAAVNLFKLPDDPTRGTVQGPLPSTDRERISELREILNAGLVKRDIPPLADSLQRGGIRAVVGRLASRRV